MGAFRVLYNQDSTNLFYVTQEPITAAHVDRMVDEVAAGGADVLLINPNAQRVNYPSRVWQTFWDGYTPGDRAFFGGVAEAEIPGRAHMVGQMQRLAASGCDYLARALARCREEGITPGVSVRMNDMHDAPIPDSHLFSRFYREHPEWPLDNPSAGWGRAGLNYAVPEVRAYFLALLRELVESYDLEVLELDFLRFTSYFPREDLAQNAATMTAWLGEVRALLATAPRRIELIPRVATSPDAAYELGFDVAAWAREGLVDGLTAGAFLNTNWDIRVAEFGEVMGGTVPVYAGTDVNAQVIAGLPECQLPLHPELMRGLAAGYAAVSAAGLNFFNFFCTREGDAWKTASNDPCFSVLGELRDPEKLRGKAKAYTVTGATEGGVLETDRPAQLPVTLGANRVREFWLLMQAEAEGTATVEIRGTGAPEALWLRLNAHAAGPAHEVATEGELSVARWSLPAAALRAGENRLQLRNEGPEIMVLGLDVLVNP